MIRPRLNRRAVLGLGAGTGVLGAIPLLQIRGGVGGHGVAHEKQEATPVPEGAAHDAAPHELSPTKGDVDVEAMGFDPAQIVRTFDYGEATKAADGTTVREYNLIASGDKQIEIAPGVHFQAWTYNG